MIDKILIVDDDVDFAEELSEMLSLSGYQPFVASDAADVVDVAQKLKPQLIVLDIKMNGLNGFQVSDRLSQCIETSCIPIIIMTGHFTNDEHFHLMNILGIKHMLKKPFTPLDLISRIETTLGTRREI